MGPSACGGPSHGWATSLEKAPVSGGGHPETLQDPLGHAAPTRLSVRVQMTSGASQALGDLLPSLCTRQIGDGGWCGC